MQTIPLDMFKTAEVLEDIFDDDYKYYAVGYQQASQRQIRSTRSTRTRRVLLASDGDDSDAAQCSEEDEGIGHNV